MIDDNKIRPLNESRTRHARPIQLLRHVEPVRVRERAYGPVLFAAIVLFVLAVIGGFR